MLNTPTPEQLLLVEQAKEYQRQHSSSDNGDTENVEKRQLKRPRSDSEDESTSPKKREGGYLFIPCLYFFFCYR